MRWVVLILSILPLFANAGYQRNVAKPVDKVVIGQNESVRNFSSVEI